MPSIWTIGYEKVLPPALLAELQAAGVERVLDVRYRPQSRRPGRSKTRLSDLLAEHDIAYEHRHGLGRRPTSAGCSRTAAPSRDASSFVRTSGAVRRGDTPLRVVEG